MPNRVVVENGARRMDHSDEDTLPGERDWERVLRGIADSQRRTLEQQSKINGRLSNIEAYMRNLDLKDYNLEVELGRIDRQLENILKILQNQNGVSK